jgi:hypothetical protein
MQRCLDFTTQYAAIASPMVANIL